MLTTTIQHYLVRRFCSLGVTQKILEVVYKTLVYMMYSDFCSLHLTHSLLRSNSQPLVQIFTSAFGQGHCLDINLEHVFDDDVLIFNWVWSFKLSKNKLTNIIAMLRKIVGLSQMSLKEFFTKEMWKKAKRFVGDFSLQSVWALEL